MALARRYRTYHPYLKVRKRSQSKQSHLNVAKKRNEDEYNRLDKELSSLSGDIHEDERYEKTQLQVENSARNIKKNSFTFKDNETVGKAAKNRVFTIRDPYGDRKVYKINYDNWGQVRYIMDVFNSKLAACKRKFSKFIKLYGADETNYTDFLKEYRQDIENKIAYYEKIVRTVTESALESSNLYYDEFMQATSFVNRRLKSKSVLANLNIDEYNFGIDGDDDFPDDIENFPFGDDEDEQSTNAEGEAAYSDDEMDKFLAANIFDDEDDELSENNKPDDDEMDKFLPANIFDDEDDELSENDQPGDDEKMEF